MNKRSIRTLSTLGVLAACAISPASAALLTYEGFAYAPAASITGQTGGTGWRTPSNPAWNGSPSGTVAATGLSYTGINPSYTAFASSGLAANMGAAVRNDRFLAIDAPAAYATAGLRATDGNYIGGSTVTGNLYGSFLVSASLWDTASGPQMVFNLTSNTGTGTSASIRQTGAGSAITLTNNGGGGIGATGSIATSSLSTSNPNLLVFRYGFNGAADDTLSIWLNPTSESDLAAITATQANFVLNDPEMRSVNANGNLVFDEIRFGTTFADVVPVPEPSALALLGLAMFGFAAGNRRRKSGNTIR